MERECFTADEVAYAFGLSHGVSKKHGRYKLDCLWKKAQHVAVASGVQELKRVAVGKKQFLYPRETVEKIKEILAVV